MAALAVAVFSCGSPAAQKPDGGGTGGAGVGSGGGGAGAVAGTASGGSVGSGGAPGVGTGGIVGSGGSGQAGAGGAASGGNTASGGRGGSAGTGGGAAGAGGAAGGGSPCQAVLTLARSCATAADCFAGEHVINCCGQVDVVGFNVTERTRFQTLESQCDATYPPCGCAATQPMTDDGSRLRFAGQAGVACVQGICTTYVPDCGKPCGAGTTCFSCANHAAMFAACTTTCASATACSDVSLPKCQTGTSGNIAGMYCTASNVTCDTR